MGLGKKQLNYIDITPYSKGKDACSAEFDRTVTSRPLARGGQKILPKLEINDTVEYQGNKYIVCHITYNYLSKAQMTLGVENYEAPPLAEESKPEEETETPKEETEPEEGDLFENPEKLDELQSIDKPNPDKPSPDARQHFIDIAKAVYKDYQNIGKEQEFQKIYITSAWRSRTNQYGILEGKLEKKPLGKGKFSKNMYEYYKSAHLSAPYLKIIQYLYDGVYISMPEGDKYETVVPESDYLAIKDASNREKFRKMILEAGFSSLNRKEKAKDILEQSHVVQKLYNPSRHVSDIPNRNATALDIRTYAPYTDTAAKFFDKNGGDKNGYEGFDHHHMSYKP